MRVLLVLRAAGAAAAPPTRGAWSRGQEKGKVRVGGRRNVVR